MENTIILNNELVDKNKEILVTQFSLNDEELNEMYEVYNNLNKNEKNERIMTRKQFIDKVINKNKYNNIDNEEELDKNKLNDKKLKNENDFIEVKKEKNIINKNNYEKEEIIKKKIILKFNPDNFYLNEINKYKNQIKIIIMSDEQYYHNILTNYLYGFIKPTDKIIYINRINKEFEKVKKNMIIKTNNLNIDWWEKKLENIFNLYFFVIKSNKNDILLEKFKNNDNIHFIDIQELNEKLLEKNINKMYKKLFEIFKNKVELSKLGAFERIKGMNLIYKEIIKKNKKKYFNEFFHIEY